MNFKFFTLVGLLVAGLSSVYGGTLYWDADGSGASGNPPTSGVGGTGTWNNSNSLWWSGTSYQSWTGSGGEDIAQFYPTVGTVTVSGTVNANQIRFNSYPNPGGTSVSGYLIQSGTINLTGVATIDTTDTISGASNVTINSAITGSNGLTKTGTRRVILGGTNTYSGNTTVSVGLLDINSNGALPTTTILNSINFEVRQISSKHRPHWEF